MYLNRKWYLALFLAVIVTVSYMTNGCTKDDVETKNEEPKEVPQEKEEEKKDDDNNNTGNTQLKKVIRNYMNVCFPYYYWHDDMKSTVDSLNINDFKTIESFFEATLYPKDRWSWMADGSYYAQNDAGEREGSYGAVLKQQIEYYNDYNIYVSYVYPDSPFDKMGVKRGWILTHLAGRPVMETVRDGSIYKELYYSSEQTFTFKDNEGNDHTFTTESADLETRSSLMSTIFWPADFPGLTEPVGYFHYLTFNASFLDDIHEAMKYFKSANLHKMILDLRYNGGGDSRASQLLIDYLAPKTANHLPYVHRSHNKEHQNEDVIDSIDRQPGALDLNALYVIVGSQTASASEMIINGLRPYLNTTMVGDTTYGKPNGMYIFMYPGTPVYMAKYYAGDYSSLQYVFLPIAFFNKNGIGEMIPEDGFIPDNYRPDDLTHNFGVDEDNIKACLTKIVSDTFPDLPQPHRRVPARNSDDNVILRDYRKNPFYGMTIEPFPGQQTDNLLQLFQR